MSVVSMQNAERLENNRILTLNAGIIISDNIFLLIVIVVIIINTVCPGIRVRFATFFLVNEPDFCCDNLNGCAWQVAGFGVI